MPSQPALVVDGLEVSLGGRPVLRSLGFTFPLIAVTARSDADTERRVRAASFDGFLRKPVTGQMLADAIAAACPQGAAS